METDHAINAHVIGRSWVQGTGYLTEGLALAVLNRQLGKKSSGFHRAKFLPNLIQFIPFEHNRRSRVIEDVYYDNIRKLYTFSQFPEVLMLCVEGFENQNTRVYPSFRFSSVDELLQVRRRIQNGYSGVNMYHKPTVYSVKQEPVHSRTIYHHHHEHHPKSHGKTIVASSSPAYLERIEPVRVATKVERVCPPRSITPVAVQPVNHCVTTTTYVPERSSRMYNMDSLDLRSNHPVSTYYMDEEFYDEPVLTRIVKAKQSVAK